MIIPSPTVPTAPHIPPLRPINLALQGGGSHGAFTWGVLDKLLEDGRFNFEGISGTSAGAMNAVALAHGMAVAAGQPPEQVRESARASLKSFWDGVVQLGALNASISKAQRLPLDILFGGFKALTGSSSPGQMMTEAMSSLWSTTLSPYQTNPLNLNPLKDLLERQVDFDRLAASQACKVFVVATAVSTGKAEVFSGKRLTAKAVMASACLPTLFRAIEIDGEHYWDGGYSGNPAIHPLIYQCDSRDIVLVQINPLKRDTVPTTAGEILDRLNEITFNAALMAEMRAIDFVKRLLHEGKLDATRYKDVLMHRIDGGATLDAYTAASKSATDAKLIYALCALGQQCGEEWLNKKSKAVGTACSISIAHDYLDDLRVPIARDTPPHLGV
jgi:NTE family protein